MAAINTLWLRFRCWAPRGSYTGAPSGESWAGLAGTAAAAVGKDWRESARGVQDEVGEGGCRVWVLVGIGRAPRLTSHHAMLGPFVPPRAGDGMREASHSMVLPSCAPHQKTTGTSDETAVYLMVLVEAGDDAAVRREALGQGLGSWELTPVFVKEGTSDESPALWGDANGSQGGATQILCSADSSGAAGGTERDESRMSHAMQTLQAAQPVRRSLFLYSLTNTPVLVRAEPCAIAPDRPGLVREVLLNLSARTNTNAPVCTCAHAHMQ